MNPYNNVDNETKEALRQYYPRMIEFCKRAQIKELEVRGKLKLLEESNESLRVSNQSIL